MPGFSHMNDGPEYQSISSEEDGSDNQPSSSEEEGSDYQPCLSEEDELESEPCRPRKTDDYILIDQVTLNHRHLRAGTDLEVGTVISKGQTLELHHKSFLMVTELRRYKTGSVTFVGYLFRPIEELEDYLPVTFGGSEVVWLCEAKEQDPKPEGYLRSASSKDVLRIRQLGLTNSECASDTFLQSPPTGMFTDGRPLVCQWILVAELSKSHRTKISRSCRSFGVGSQSQPKAFIALSDQEPFVGQIKVADNSQPRHHTSSDPLEATTDNGPCQPKKHRRALGRNLGKGKERCRDAGARLVLGPNTNGNRIAKATRSPARRKSSYHLEMDFAHVLGISSAQQIPSEQDIEPKTYTFADAFCGAGGMSIGARDAGLRIEWAFDQDGDAIKTYTLNHGANTCKQISAQHFLEAGNAYGTSKVDILHLSPPCQGFALACRGSPRNGEQDNQCMAYVGGIVEKVKPRIVTFEEVRNVLFKSREYFKKMVRDLTSIGYNVRWRIIECVDFGVPQKRSRLFLIASCRGEPLPDFPKPTHSHYAYCDDLGLQPWNTFEGAIDNLRASAPNHLDAHPRKERRIERWAPSHQPDWPCRGTVTTGENWPDHYNGKYKCTVREAACLQGFPANYEFLGSLSATQKQVVNAVPPPVAKVILEEVKRSLMRTDASRRT